MVHTMDYIKDQHQEILTNILVLTKILVTAFVLRTSDKTM